MPVKKQDEVKLLKNVPWITKDGNLDLTKFPIDSTLKQALSADDQKFRSACRMLASMCDSGRTEAGIFLWGLLEFYQNDLVKKQAIVDALAHFKTKKTAELLFTELDETESSNSTRGYINTVLTTLSNFPPILAEEGFTRLLGDKKWSYRMKRKFQAILEGADWRYL